MANTTEGVRDVDVDCQLLAVTYRISPETGRVQVFTPGIFDRLFQGRIDARTIEEWGGGFNEFEHYFPPT